MVFLFLPIPQYTTVQELYESRPLSIDPGYPDLLVRLAAERGLVHVAKSAPPQWPSVCMGTMRRVFIPFNSVLTRLICTLRNVMRFTVPLRSHIQSVANYVGPTLRNDMLHRGVYR